MTQSERDHLHAVLIIGDLDKPFHRCECECERCEQWRQQQGQPTHAEIRARLGED